MTLMRYEPWRFLDRLQRQLHRECLRDQGNQDFISDDGSESVISHWRPAVDIKEEEERFVIYADLPGVDPKDIEITTEQGVLVLKGERSAEKKDERDGYTRTERFRGSCYRRFSLPSSADTDNIQATGKNGVLKIVLPKHEKMQPRRIAVQG